MGSPSMMSQIETLLWQEQFVDLKMVLSYQIIVLLFILIVVTVKDLLEVMFLKVVIILNQMVVVDVLLYMLFKLILKDGFQLQLLTWLQKNNHLVLAKMKDHLKN